MEKMLSRFLRYRLCRIAAQTDPHATWSCVANVEHEDALMKSRTSKENVAAMIMMRASRQATTTSFCLNGWNVRAGAWASFGSIGRWSSISLFSDEGVWLVVSCAIAVLLIVLQSLLQPSVDFFWEENSS